jgi:hypothetical protein
VNFISGNAYSTFSKSIVYCVRAFRCVTY